MYGTSTNFAATAWDCVIQALAENIDQNLELASRETYRVALPLSLTCSALTSHKFTISSCLPCTHAFSGEATYELLHSLLTQLSTKFGCNAHPEVILAREPAEQEGMDTETPNKKVGVPRRAVLRAMGAVGATVAGAWPVSHALAQSDPSANYPNKPIRVIIPFVAGGSGDTVIRAVGLRLTAAWGQQVVIENRAGASGALGLQVASKSPPDGYTLVLGTSSTHAINPHLQQDLGYDAFRDFAPVAMLITAPNVMVAHPSVPANNLRELIALAKAQPGKLSFASNGAGTVSHLSGELLNSEAMIKLLHVPYKGAGQAVNDVLGGHVPLLIGALPTTLAHVNAGRLKAIGVTTAQRSPAAPAIPTFAESALAR
jgi:tripartite-type tricarboxylate transporter receptor subunit TctC